MIWRQEIRQVYNNHIDSVDLIVGLFAEQLPAGFSFSDTAFPIFVLMASRRLNSDRFFTTDYTEEIYTKQVWSGSIPTLFRQCFFVTILNWRPPCGEFRMHLLHG